ncbi:transporter substrate-binding domain-containing protein [Pseudomonas sp. JQ170]|uniref:transporter substrate-binding domain-containing protein n=1 Tax=unclassified Pseudomonas TaxID=196821 RepID=UPI00264F8492|nr:MULTISPECIES: transporter substrate-binding domain-containing protein [unclassified Pseudomonas]MDN7142271.1 transporter substrate-binding domain-containing protein [Pseudomonas sp. JQ170]WRO76827.1 transporter substrate-binding domain-containing protein [Pseudomonas sp. 170C]
MKTTTLLTRLALSTLLGLSLTAHADEQNLRLGIEASYPPFAYKSQNNELQGFDYDIGEALCAQMKVSCQWKEIEFDGLIPSLKVRKIDAAISSVSITDERKRSVDFTHSYYRIPAKLVTRQGNGIEQIPQQLDGKRVGVQRGTNFDRYATEKFAPLGAEIVRYGTQNEVFLDLLAGRLDASLAGMVAIEEGLFKQAEGAAFHFVGPDYSEERYFGYGAGMAVRKNDPLGQRLNDALAAIKANGTYDSIRKKYFSIDISGN